jgi:hypothetical protein
LDTVRYYERLKPLARADRSSGNFRLFAPESIERVRFIKQAQELRVAKTVRGDTFFIVPARTAHDSNLADLNFRQG